MAKRDTKSTAMNTEHKPEQEPSYEEQWARYAAHMEYRKRLEEALLEVTGRFTQWSLTLSGGALALSLTYVEKLNPAMDMKGLLIGSWVFLAASIVSNLFSLHCSSKATHEAIELSDRQLQNWRKDHTAVFANAVNTSSEWTTRISMASLISFAAGISLFCLFVYFCPPSVRTEVTPAHHGQTTHTSAASIATPYTNTDPTQ